MATGEKRAKDIKNIKKLLSDMSIESGGDSKLFMLFQLALCGHMNDEAQRSFLNDAQNRGLI